MRVEWSEQAVSQLQGIRDYIARSSPGYARLMADRIIRRTEDLDRFPEIGAEVSEYAGAGIRELLEHPYRILYRLDGDRVQIVAVLHSARKLPLTPPG